MAQDSKLLISDYIVPDPVTPDDIGPVSASLVMMAVAGKERTLEDFQHILDAAGLRITGVFKPANEHFGIVEAMLKETIEINEPATSTVVQPVS